MSEERVGGRAGTAAPQGAVCELPNPPLFFLLSSRSNPNGTMTGVIPRLFLLLHRAAFALHPRVAGQRGQSAKCCGMNAFRE
jgi:hypothetical protein